ncbi:hypothetical protein HG535_0F05210 [Zygotorulaspora mrakii]|uniref:Uncharacterized protein n=1 Tax=Zygotorulaspora mrakii TaxID=42260 RepID=A0A7H9B7Q1_ZYGMR|nr:uncharacterized protein HG535_0F05210 [Zygotorulaspora mrakii]QLG74009.1 hypothetical protein HG535_0F05210 [Zygotorulaspora mrakii]
MMNDHLENRTNSCDHYIQPQEIVVPDYLLLEDKIQCKIDSARRESEQLHQQIDKVRSKACDAQLLEMTRNVGSLNKNKVNLRPTILLRGHNSKISSFKWAHDSKSILSASQDGFMIIWDSVSGFKKNAIPLDSQWVLSCGISPSNALVSSAGLNNNCTIYRVSKEHKVQQNVVSIFKGHTGYISDTDFMDNSHVVTASGDMTCAYWDIPKAKRVREYADHLGDVLALSIPNEQAQQSGNNIFASCGSDGYSYISDIRAPTMVQSFFVGDADVNAIQFFRDGNSIVTGSDDGVSRMFDLRSDCSIAEFSLSHSIRHEKHSTHTGSTVDGGDSSSQRAFASLTSPSYLDNQGVVSLDFSGSGRLMYACYTDVGCYVWDVLKAEIVGKLEGHSNRISGVRTSPDGQAVCTGSWDSTMKIWTPGYM